MKGWLILLVLCVAIRMYGQRVEVPGQVYKSTRPAVEVSSIRGYVADPSTARILKAKLSLQKKSAAEFVEAGSAESDRKGEFDFGKALPGVYRLIVRARGFCEVSIPIKLSGTGWSGLRITLPIGVTDTPSGYCDEHLKLEPLEK